MKKQRKTNLSLDSWREHVRIGIRFVFLPLFYASNLFVIFMTCPPPFYLQNNIRREASLLSEKGNVLFLILIGVILFAALAYSVTASLRNSGKPASKDKDKMRASVIFQYGTDLEHAITRLKLTNKCSNEEISFENPIVGGYTNSNSPANYSCHVFRPEGGNAVFQTLDTGLSSFQNPIFLISKVPWIGVHTLEDIALKVRVSESVCRSLNELAGLGYDTALTSGWYHSMFTGTFPGTNGTSPDLSGNTKYYGKQSICFVYGLDPTIFLYQHVILPR